MSDDDDSKYAITGLTISRERFEELQAQDARDLAADWYHHIRMGTEDRFIDDTIRGLFAGDLDHFVSYVQKRHEFDDNLKSKARELLSPQLTIARAIRREILACYQDASRFIFVNDEEPGNYQRERESIEAHHDRGNPIAIIIKRVISPYRNFMIPHSWADFLLDIQFETPERVLSIEWEANGDLGSEFRHVCQSRLAPVNIKSSEPYGQFTLWYCKVSQEWTLKKKLRPYTSVAFEYTSPANMFAEYRYERYCGVRGYPLDYRAYFRVTDEASARTCLVLFPSPDKIMTPDTTIDWIDPKLIGTVYNPRLCRLARKNSPVLLRDLRRTGKTLIARRVKLWLD